MEWLCRRWAVLPEAAVAVALVWGAVALGLGVPSAESREYRPVPDAAENAWVALRLAHGESPLLPIANDLHPSRYSPVHPFLASLWIRLHGGRAGALHTWPLAALLAGCAFLYGWMALGGMWAPTRLVVLGAILFSPLSFRAARELLQEPSIFFLFWGTVLCWFLAVHWAGERSRGSRAGGRRGAAGAVCGAAAGIGAMALTSIRPTLVVLPVLCLLHFVWVGGRYGRRARARLVVSFLVGALLCFLAIVFYMERTAGVVGLSDYSHWDPDFQRFAFDWRRVYRLDPRLGDRSRMEVIGGDLFGVSRRFSEAGWAGGLLLLIGCVWCGGTGWRRADAAALGTVRDRRGAAFRSQSIPLLLFFASQVAAQLCFVFWEDRFFILVYPLFVVLGAIGLERLIRELWNRRDVRPRVAFYLAVTVGVAVAGVGRLSETLDGLESFRPSRGRIERIERVHHAQQFCGLHVREAGAPLFVDRIPVLNGRLLLGLEDYPYPISQMFWFNYLYWDGQTVQFNMFRVGPARGKVEPGAPWLSPPNDSCLIDSRSGEPYFSYLRALLRWYGKVALYYPASRESQVCILLDWAKREGIRRELTEEHAGRVLVILDAAGERGSH